MCVRPHNEEINAMKLNSSPRPFLLAGAVLVVSAMIVAGCQSSNHPDEKAAVTSSLNNDNLGSVNVSQDREKGIMTLKGNVASEADRQQAENIAKQSAPDYAIADEIGVRPPDVQNAGAVASDLDSAIEDNFKATIKAHENLNDQSIHASAKNGTLIITGSVKTPNQKTEVSTLAKHVPNVQEVVNELDVKPDKHSAPNS
jgi:hyperosmotically inducible protein